MAFITSNTGFKANHISASSMTVNSVSGSLVSSASFGSVEVAGFSGGTNLLNFSASINTDSASVSTRLSSVEAGTTTKTLLSGSAQIFAEISGAFGEASGGLAGRITTNVANIASNQASIGSNQTNISTLQGRSIDTGTGLSGGGDLSADRTLAVDFSDAVLQTNISGAFATDSASFNTRLSTIEGSDITNAQALGTVDSPTFSGLTVKGDVTAENLIVSSSIVHFTQSFSSGSTVFGDTTDDTHVFAGTLSVSGSDGSSNLDIKYSSGNYSPINLNGNNTMVPNLNADLLDGTELDAIPAYVATNLAANAISGDKITGGTIDSTTITKLAIGDLSIGSVNDNELHVRNIQNISTISGSSGASASLAYIESTRDGAIAGNIIHTINVTYSAGKFNFNGVAAPNFTVLPGYTYRFNQDDSSNASQQIGFKSDGNAYTTGVRVVGTAGNAGVNADYTELTVTQATSGILTYYSQGTGADDAGAKLVKEGSAGHATLVSGSVASTGSFGRIETADGVIIDNGHVSGSLTSTGSFGSINVAGFAATQPNVVDFSASMASAVTGIGSTNITSMSSAEGTIEWTINGAERKADINWSDADVKAGVSGSWRGEFSSSTQAYVGGGISGSSASTYTVGSGGVEIANHVAAQKTHVGVSSGGSNYAISGSAVSTGSFGKLETVEGASLGNGVSGSLTSTGSFGHIFSAGNMVGATGTTASFDNVKVAGFSDTETNRLGTNTGTGLTAFSASIAQRVADEMDDIEGQFTVVGDDIESIKNTRISGSLVVSSSAGDTALTIEGAGENVLNVDGTAGRLFTISDTMSGSLFSVADFSGLASLEVFDNDRVTLGINTAPIIVETNAAQTSAKISGSIESSASFGHVTAAGKAILKDVDLLGNMIPTSDVATDLGSATKRFANLYVGDLLLSNRDRVNPDTDRVGNSVDGTWGDFQLQEGHEDLFIENKRTGKTYKFVLQEVDTQEL